MKSVVCIVVIKTTFSCRYLQKFETALLKIFTVRLPFQGSIILVDEIFSLSQ